MKDKILIEGTETTAAAYPNAVNGPWTAAIYEAPYRDGKLWYTIEYTSPNHSGGTYQKIQRGGMDLEELKQVLANQITKVAESGVTEDAPRFGSCTYCDRKVTPAGYQLWDARPWAEEDDNYDGCRGWD